MNVEIGLDSRCKTHDVFLEKKVVDCGLHVINQQQPNGKQRTTSSIECNNDDCEPCKYYDEGDGVCISNASH